MKIQNSWLVRNASAILTGLSGAAARHAGPDIRIVDGRISAIGALQPQPGERVLDATDCVVYPAWVNTHHHLFQSLLKGIPAGIDQSLGAWLGAVPYRYRGAFDEQSFRLAARIGLVELARSGCATVADHHYLYLPGMDFDSAEVLFEEAERLGLRFVLCRGGATQARQAEGKSVAGPETLEQYLDDVERLVRRYRDPAADAWRRVVMAPTSPPYSMPAEHLRETAQVARRLGIRLHSHLSETVEYQNEVQQRHGMSPGVLCRARVAWAGRVVRAFGETRRRGNPHARGQRYGHCALPAKQWPPGQWHCQCGGHGGCGNAGVDWRGWRRLQRGLRHDQRNPRRLADATGDRKSVV